MARPLKSGLDYFPLWKPQRITESRFHSGDFKVKYRALRNSSSAFIKRKDVRRIILSKYNNRCVFCGSIDNLEIDHIVSVYLCAKGLFEICKLNTEENLTILCGSCNARRCPNGKT
jgi:5-methylcytosine-specific restriction endonuclease McrA